MVPVSDRVYYPPTIGDEDPSDVFEYDSQDELTYILKRTRRGIITTSNIAVFIDGACEDNGMPYARAGMGVYFGDDSCHNMSMQLTHGRITSQRAELWAAILALRKVRRLTIDEVVDARTVVLVSDSTYLVNAMTDWVEKWKANGWRRTNGEELRNAEDFKILDGLIEELEDSYGVYVKLWHVPRGDNQDADQLAKRCL